MCPIEHIERISSSSLRSRKLSLSLGAFEPWSMELPSAAMGSGSTVMQGGQIGRPRPRTADLGPQLQDDLSGPEAKREQSRAKFQVGIGCALLEAGSKQGSC